MENEVRELLREIAEDIPPQQEAPPRLGQRTRRRIAATVGATLVAVAAVILGSIVAVRSITTSSPPKPAKPGPTPQYADRFSPVHAWIAYRDGSEIVAVDPTNPIERIVLGPAKGEADPIEWSRDGTRLLLQRTSAGARGIRSDLFVMRPDGSVIQLTHDGRSGAGSFSPDGTMVVYEVSDRGLYVVDTDGGIPRLLVADDRMRHRWLQSPAWSPDGSRIAFAVHNEEETTFSIWVVNPDGTGRRKLIDLGECGGGGCTGGLTWSPDGSWLAFHSARGAKGNAQIYVMSADGSGLKQITFEFSNLMPTWSPDGSRIAFVRLEALYTMAPDGTDVRGVEGVWIRGPIAWNPIS